MHAFILINTDPNEFAKKQNAKIMPFTMQKIEDARELKKFVKFSFSEKTAIIINDIDKITPEAANAFLKNLEEPTKNIIYILTASNLSNVLPTIISRCQIVKSTNPQIYKSTNINMDYDYKDALNIKDREEAIKFIENLIYQDHENQNFKNMENYLNTIQNLRANGNVSLQLTNFVVRMNRNG